MSKYLKIRTTTMISMTILMCNRMKKVTMMSLVLKRFLTMNSLTKKRLTPTMRLILAKFTLLKLKDWILKLIQNKQERRANGRS